MTSLAQLRPNGRYNVALSAYVYVAIATGNPDAPFALFAPPDCTYPKAPHMMVLHNGYILTHDHKVATITVDDLDFSGRYHDHATNSAKPTNT